MDFTPFPQLEAALYRRSDEQPSSPLECHNHILQGSYLRYIKRSLRPKDIGRYRLVLVQGTLRGRLQSIRLHSGSTVTAVTTASASSDFSKYEIHVSGTDDCKIRTILGSQEVKWLISFPSEEVQQKWLSALKNACDFAGNWPKKDEIDRLKDLARKMRGNVDARMRFHRFKLIPRCFVGRRAIRWIVKYEGCTAYQATVIGQKMLNLGLFQHITNEHVFCNKKLLYQFPINFDQVQIPKNSGSHLATLTSRNSSQSLFNDSGAEIDKDDRVLMRKMSMNTEELVQALHVSNQSLLSVQSSLSDLQTNFNSLETLIDQSIRSERKAFANQHKSDIVTALLQTLLLVYCLASQFPDWYLVTRTAVIGIATLTVVGSAVLGRGFGAFMPLRNKRIGFSQRSDGEAYMIILAKITAALHSSKENSPSPRHLDAFDPFRDPDYDSGDSDLEGMDADDIDSEDDSDADYDDDEKSQDDEEEDDDDDDCDDEDDDESDDDGDNLDDNDEEYADKEGDDELKSTEQRVEKKASLDSPRPPHSGGKSSLVSAEKSIMKPSMWPNYPLLLKRSRTMFPSGTSTADMKRLSAPIHIHQPGEPELSEFPIESDIFIGKAFVIIANLHDSPSHFNRKERKFEAVIQGRFKRSIPFAHLYTGQAYNTPIKHIPAKWLVNAGLQFMTRLQPAHQACLEGDHPYILSPFASTAQRIIITKPGNEPSISYGIDALEENMSLLDPIFRKMSHRKRKAYFAKRENLARYSFDPSFVYTFDLYQHRLDLSTFKIDLGFVNYDLRQMLGCRPIQIMAVEWIPPNEQGTPKHSPKSNEKSARDLNNEFLLNEMDWKFMFHVEIWHKRCLTKASKKVSIATPESTGSEHENKKNSALGTHVKHINVPELSNAISLVRSFSLNGREGEKKAAAAAMPPSPKALRPSSAPSFHSPGRPDDTKSSHKSFGIMSKLRSSSGDANGGSSLLHWGGGSHESPYPPSNNGSPMVIASGPGIGIAYSNGKKVSPIKTVLFKSQNTPP